MILTDEVKKAAQKLAEDGLQKGDAQPLPEPYTGLFVSVNPSRLIPLGSIVHDTQIVYIGPRSNKPEQ